MNEQCSVGINAETLSAWRSRLLTPQEQQSITTHIAGCTTCQQIIAGFDRVAQILRAPPRMPAQDAIWRGIQASIAGQRRSTIPPISRALLISVGASVALATVFIVVFVTLANRTGNSQPITITSTATPTATTIPSPTITPTPLPNKWQTVASIHYGKAIAFAQSDPQTGYICGNTGTLPSTLELGVTHDGGFTWTTHSASGITGTNCALNVNPYDANDIVLSDLPCWFYCGGNNYDPYRSFDGGKTWTHLILPPGNEFTGWIYPGSPAWTPTALFFLTGVYNPIVYTPPTYEIAASVNRGPLTWVSNPGPPASNIALSIFTNGNSVNAYDEVLVNGKADHWDLATSTDNGATWTHVTPRSASGSTGVLPNAVQPVSDGQVLIGVVSGSTDYLRSTDGGKTWDRLPNVPGNITTDAGAQMTPDGSIFGLVGNANTDVFIYKLAPGGSSWTAVASMAQNPNGSQPAIVVSCDANGHPKIIWSATSNASGPSYNRVFQMIVEYHPA